MQHHIQHYLVGKVENITKKKRKRKRNTTNYPKAQKANLLLNFLTHYPSSKNKLIKNQNIQFPVNII
jgi:hypothetical protein